ncbi:MAG: hypothetical protein OKBPIBMD_00275 [Chlorobi bacterium]|nr:hypothetical protein [Chlorobiota bacterium]
MREFILCMVFALFASSSLAQTVGRPVSILDYRFLVPTTQAVHNNRLFLGFNERHGLYEGDIDNLKMTQSEQFFDIPVRRLFRFDHMQRLLTGTDELYYYNNSRLRWEKIGDYVCTQYGDGNRLFALGNEEVVELTFNGDDWKSTHIASLPNHGSEVISFAIVRDTLVYAEKGSKNLIIATLSGQIVRTIETFNTAIDELLMMDDGTVGIASLYQLSQILSPDSLASGGLRYLYYEQNKQRPLGLTSATSFCINGQRGVIGIVAPPFGFGSDPRAGIYEITHPDFVGRRQDLDSMFTNPSRIQRQDESYILSTRGCLMLIDGSGKVSKVNWLADTLVGFSGDISFSANGQPFTTGLATVDTNRFPAMFPTSDSQGITVLPSSEAGSYPLIRYVHLEGGPEVAFCNYGIFKKEGIGQWIKVMDVNGGINNKRIVVLNDSTIVCNSKFRHIILSTDKGRTWTTREIDKQQAYVSSAIASSRTLYCLSQGRIWASNYTTSSNPTAPVVLALTPSAHQYLFECSNSVVKCITARFDADPSQQSLGYTSLVCHQWNIESGQLDSAVHSLSKPLSNSFGLTMFAQNDTAYLWDSPQRRLLAVTYNGIVYDTTLPASAFGPLGNEQLPYIFQDNNGNPWLFNTSLVTGFRLYPSVGTPTGILDYYNYLYVQDLHPNPATQNVTVTIGRFTAATEATMRLLLYDATGNIVRDYTPQLKSFSGPISRQDVRINIAGLPAGLYFVVIANEQGMHARKLVVLQ